MSQDASDGKDYEEQTKDNIMESLENLYLLSQHASEYNVSLSDDEKKAIKDAAEQFGKDNTDQAKDVVSGSTDTIEKLLELLTIQNKMDTAIKDTETVTADDITMMRRLRRVCSMSYSHIRQRMIPATARLSQTTRKRH